MGLLRESKLASDWETTRLFFLLKICIYAIFVVSLQPKRYKKV